MKVLMALAFSLVLVSPLFAAPLFRGDLNGQEQPIGALSKPDTLSSRTPDSVVTFTISNKGDTTKQVTYPSHRDAETVAQAINDAANRQILFNVLSIAAVFIVSIIIWK